MSRREQATLAGGCFWCLETVLERLGGVERVESGYTGGCSTFSAIFHHSPEQERAAREAIPRWSGRGPGTGGS